MSLVNIDLVNVRLSVLKENPEWTSTHLDLVENEYRKWLTLAAHYPDIKLLPAPDVDQFWHAHILHTKQYVEDCNRLFGKYMHHEPFHNLSEKDADDAKYDYSRMLSTYEKHFNQKPNAIWMGNHDDECRVSNCQSCTTSCVRDVAATQTLTA